jgi:ABC-type proline/glycine betaine transport system ATPase subunit
MHSHVTDDDITSTRECFARVSPRRSRRPDHTRAFADAGAAILMSTHLLGVADRLCDRVLVMNKGELVADKRGTDVKALLAGGPQVLEELVSASSLPSRRRREMVTRRRSRVWDSWLRSGENHRDRRTFPTVEVGGGPAIATIDMMVTTTAQ